MGDFDISSRKALGKVSGGGSAVSIGRPIGDGSCIDIACVESRKKGAMFCVRHQRFFDAMGYQAMEQGKAQLTEFNQAMTDSNMAVDVVNTYMAQNAGTPDMRRKTLISWAELNKKSGVRRANRDHDQAVPSENVEWILQWLGTLRSR